MIDGSDSSIRNLKLILYCFEWLAGLKINFHKSEVFVFGVEQIEKEKMANMPNCKLGDLPLKYLGIPVSDRYLSMEAFFAYYSKEAKETGSIERDISYIRRQTDSYQYMPE
jgi:hypothetical protein